MTQCVIKYIFHFFFKPLCLPYIYNVLYSGQVVFWFPDLWSNDENKQGSLQEVEKVWKILAKVCKSFWKCVTVELMLMPIVVYLQYRSYFSRAVQNYGSIVRGSQKVFPSTYNIAAVNSLSQLYYWS